MGYDHKSCEEHAMHNILSGRKGVYIGNGGTQLLTFKDGMLVSSKTIGNSPMNLGEITEAIRGLKSLDLPVWFEHESLDPNIPRYYPTCLASWRGDYAQLSIQYRSCNREDGCFPYKRSGEDFISINPPTVHEFLNMLEAADGEFFTGYKGGEYKMGPNTELYVANNGNVQGFVWPSSDESAHQRIVSVIEYNDHVALCTALV